MASQLAYNRLRYGHMWISDEIYESSDVWLIWMVSF
jgi:hypothetical protein